MASGPLMRFAFQRLAKPVGNLFKGARPADLAMRFGPDVGYALMAGTMFAPEGATAGDRAAMMGEDLVYGVGSSLVGQGIGRGLGRRAAIRGRNKSLPIADQRANYASTVNTFQTSGDVLGQMGMVALPRPVTQGVYEEAGERANQTQEQISGAQQELMEEQQLAAAMIGLAQGGYLAGDFVNQHQRANGLNGFGNTPLRTSVV